MGFRTKRELAIYLSKLKNFQVKNFMLEQYETPSEIAGVLIWEMALNSEINTRVVLDAGCGAGILGIGCLLMGAKKVYFLDKDQKVINVAIENYNKVKEEYEIGEAEFIVEDISMFNEEVDIVVQNPPFGTKEKHADKKFLEKAFSVAPLVYTFHKYSTKKFVEAITRDFGFRVDRVTRIDFPIKASFEFHTKPKKFIDVGIFKLVKDKQILF
jgi:putative methylase